VFSSLAEDALRKWRSEGVERGREGERGRDVEE
jgi:hypothetical protein